MFQITEESVQFAVTAAGYAIFKLYRSLGYLKHLKEDGTSHDLSTERTDGPGSERTSETVTAIIIPSSESGQCTLLNV